MPIPAAKVFALAASACIAWAGCIAAVRADVSTPSTPLAGYEYYAIGDIAAPRPGKVEPGLMLMGGGDWAIEAFRWMAGKAGHGHIVILRASGAAEAQEEFFRDVGGITSAQTFVFHDRASASDARMLAIVGKADGIFIAGGDQSNYVNFWKGTPLNEALNRHVRDGKPLGGTSAGLAIMGAYSYGALDGGSLTSEEALHDPLGPAVTLVKDFLQLPPLPPRLVITDSHFGKRERLGRLVVFVARLVHEQGNAGIRGLGIDENTALCIDARGEARVFSGNDGRAWLVAPPTRGQSGEPDDYRLVAGQPLDLKGFLVTGIGTGSRLWLPGFKVENPAFQSRADVVRGELKVRPLE